MSRAQTRATPESLEDELACLIKSSMNRTSYRPSFSQLDKSQAPNHRRTFLEELFWAPTLAYPKWFIWKSEVNRSEVMQLRMVSVGQRSLSFPSCMCWPDGTRD